MRAPDRLLLLLGLATLAGCADRELPTAAAPDDGRLSLMTPAPALVPTGTVCAEMQITTNLAIQLNPAVSGNRIVWQDRRNVSEDIYGYDLTTTLESPVVAEPANEAEPAIDGNLLAWVDDRNGNLDLFARDLPAGSEIQLTHTPSHEWYPAVSGSVVVWRSGQNDAGDIYAYDLQTGVRRLLVVDPGIQDEPDISGNTVVWTDYSTFGEPNVRAIDLSTGTITDITNDPTVYQAEPAISGNIVVWTDNRNGEKDIYAYDLSTNQERRLTATAEYESHPDISGNTVVFERQGANPLEDDIIAYDLATGTETAITDDAAYQTEPAISGDVIAWRDDRNGNSDIYALVCSGNASDPVQALGTLIEQVEALGPDGSGVLNQGQTNALTRKLAQTLHLLDRGQTGEAVEVLLGFRQQVLDLEVDGVLSAADGDALVAAVDAIVEALGSS